MDEPTAALTDRETETLFKVIEGLKSDGVGIVYISHRMEEIFKITDLITVMRDGFVIDTKKTKLTNADELVQKMVGRELEDYYPEKKSEIGNIVFQAKNLSGDALRIFLSMYVKGKLLVFWFDGCWSY